MTPRREPIPRYSSARRNARMLKAVAILVFVAAGRCSFAQNNYEIQVYGADTVAPKSTMVELHSNFTVDGAKALPGFDFGRRCALSDQPC